MCSRWHFAFSFLCASVSPSVNYTVDSREMLSVALINYIFFLRLVISHISVVFLYSNYTYKKLIRPSTYILHFMKQLNVRVLPRLREKQKDGKADEWKKSVCTLLLQGKFISFSLNKYETVLKRAASRKWRTRCSCLEKKRLNSALRTRKRRGREILRNFHWKFAD